MRKSNNAEMVITSVASCGIIALAYYERYAPSDKLPAVVFYLVAAAICLLPIGFAFWRRSSGGQRMCNE
jgi:hypothetical protein